MAAPAAPDARRLLFATLGSALIAGVVLFAAILPAEYGIDPTGFGGAIGLTRIHAAPDAGVDPAPPGAPVETFSWGSRWALAEREVGNWSGALTSSASQASFDVPIALTNLTKLTARLLWVDDVPATGPDTLEVSVRGPGTRSELATSDAGFANATLVVRGAPYPREENGTLVVDLAADASGMGDYRVVVRLYGTGGTDATPDEGNPFTLRLFAETYAFEITSDGSPADRVALTIPPGRGVEYKFAMDEGARMTYRWNATGPLYADLHADHFDDEDNVTTAKIIVRAEDSGSYVAPFHGRHGWYWRNDGAEPVTLALETRGTYTILGVPR